MRIGIGVLAFVAVAAQAEQPSDYAYGMAIADVARAPYVRVALPTAIYESVVHADLADLRVFNAAGEVVPFAFVPRPAPARSPAARLPTFPLHVDRDHPSVEGLALTVQRSAAGTTISVDSREGDNAAGRVLAGYVLDASAQEEPLAALTFALPEKAGASSMRMRIDASDDLASWRTIAGDATLVDLEHAGQRLVKDRVELPPTRAKYLRVSWAPGRPVIDFVEVKAEFGARVAEAPREWRAAAGSAVEDRPGDYAYDAGGAYPVDRIAVDLPVANSIVPVAVFARRAATRPWHAMGSTVFYRLAQESGDVGSPPFAVQGEGRREWLLRIDPRAGVTTAPPMRFGWRPQEIVFAARGTGSFTLAFGKFAATPGALPIETLVPDYPKTRALPANVALAMTQARVDLGGADRLRKPPDVMRWLLWAVLGIGALALGWMAWRLSRDMKAKPAPDGESAGKDS